MRTFHVRPQTLRAESTNSLWVAYRVIATGPRGGETVIGIYYNENDAVNLVQELRQAERGAVR
jgi:hypothetical protein